MAGKERPRKKRDNREKRGLGFAFLSLVQGLVALILLFDMDYDILPFLDLGTSAPMHNLLLIVVVLGFVWFALRLLGVLVETVAVPRAGSYANVRRAWKAVSYTVWAVFLVVLFFILLGDLTSSVLSIGLIGAALTFALQKPLMNIAGWISINFNQMYNIGDRVDIVGVRGYVTDIKVMYTAVYELGGWMEGDTFSGRVSMMPNGAVFEGPVHNYTGDSPFIWDEVVNLVTYESSIDRAKEHMLVSAKEVIGDVMARNREPYMKRLYLHDIDRLILRQPEIKMVFRDSGVNLYVVYWCPAETRRNTKTEITEKIWRRFIEDPEVEIAYPHIQIVPHDVIKTTYGAQCGAPEEE